MRNITLSVPEEIYRKAKIRAAELDTSVSALVRGFLEEVARTESDFERRRRLQDEVLATVTRFRASSRLSRDEAARPPCDLLIPMLYLTRSARILARSRNPALP